MKFKIVYFIGDSIDLKTKVKSGRLEIFEDRMIIHSKSDGNIELSNISNVDLFRLYGLGRMIKLVFQNQTMFLTVIRLNVMGYFILINFFKTGKLFNYIKERNILNN